MKKSLSILMVLVMMVSMSVGVFADDLRVDSASTIDLGTYLPGDSITSQVLIYTNGGGSKYGDDGAVISFSSTTGNLTADSVTLMYSGKDKGVTSNVHGTAGAVGTYTCVLTWTTNDKTISGGGDSSVSVEFTYTVVAPLSITAPANIVNFEATGITTTIALGTATYTGGTAPITLTNNAPSAFPYGETIVTWTATDTKGNTATAIQKVTVVDTTAPVFTPAPSAKTFEATAVNTPVAAADLGTVTATDIFGPVTITNDAPGTFGLGQTTVTWTATDAHGLTSTATQIITIVDTTHPTITAPADLTKEATAVNTPVSDSELGTATATASDIFVPVTITNNAPVAFGLGTTTVTWTATDANGLTSTATQIVKIVDTTHPIITAPANITKEATAVNTPVASSELGTATATDIFGPVTITNNAPATFGLGTTTVTWTATDANGLTSTATQTVKIVDTTRPIITAPANFSKEATAVNTPVTSSELGTATATDIFGPVTITNNAPATFGLGTTTVTWTATDANGLTSTATQTVTIVDTTRPIVTAPAAITKEATAVNTPVTSSQLGTATATDIFGPVTITNNAPAAFGLGTTTVIWTATDANGLTSTATQTVAIVDTTRPIITAPANITKESAADSTPVTSSELGTASAYDIFGPVTVTNNAPSAFGLGTTTVTWTATDANGLTSTATQTVTITRPATPTPAPTATPTTAPTAAPTTAPTPTPTPTPTPAPTTAPTAAPTATPTPEPTTAPTPTPTPEPTATPTPEPTATPTPEPTAAPAPEPTPTPVPEDQDTKEPDEEAQPADEDTNIEIDDEEIPQGDTSLPKTGGIPAAVFYGFGALLGIAGVTIKRKMK